MIRPIINLLKFLSFHLVALRQTCLGQAQMFKTKNSSKAIVIILRKLTKQETAFITKLHSKGRVFKLPLQKSALGITIKRIRTENQRRCAIEKKVYSEKGCK